jgi:hypothetical protein
MSFANLKSSRGSSIDQLVKAAASVATKTETKSYIDERFWKPTQDKAGNGYAVIRFLPAKEGEDLPWVRYWDHGFKGQTGLWYIENSLTTINQPDPVSEMNTLLWNSGREEDKQTARERKRRLHYVSNIMVMSDSANPSSEGKVFLYRYGKRIFDKVMDVMQPQFADEAPINPFDFWEGADFKIKIRKVDGWTNYDKSEFSPSSALHNNDDALLEDTYKKIYGLSEFTDPGEFKSYDELKAKLNRVLGVDAGFAVEAVAPATAAPSVSMASEPAAEPESSSEEDDTLSYFAKLANES